MSNAEHTPEPWEVTDSRFIRQVSSPRHVVARVVRSGGMEANARRIVACVNACAGIGTDYLERFGATTFNDFKRVKGHRDDLLEALQSLIDMDVAYQRGPKVAQAVEVAKTAIAKATGEQ